MDSEAANVLKWLILKKDTYNAVVYFNELARKFLLEGKIEQAKYLLDTLFIDVKKLDDFVLAS